MPIQKRNPRRATGNILERTGKGLIRWLTSNHEFNVSLYLDPPEPGLLGTIRYALKKQLLSVGIPLLKALLIVVVNLIWIPFLFYALIWFLQQ